MATTLIDTSDQLPPALKVSLMRASKDGVVTLAYSGGLDSRFLAFAAKRLGFSVKLLHITGAHIAPSDTAEALHYAKSMGLPIEVIHVDTTNLKTLVTAGRARCYVCKKYLFETLLEAAKGYPLSDGTNASDSLVYRPGRKALEELGIHSPLAESGITKDEIRRLGRLLGFEAPDQAARPCLLTRFPYGVCPTQTQLKLVADVEHWIATHPEYCTLRFRLRFPDGVHPTLHVEKISIKRKGLVSLEVLKEELRQVFKPQLEQLTIEPQVTLSGFYDRQ